LKKGQISTAALRDEFRKDPALSIHAHDSVLIRAITQGIRQGDYVYRRGELLCGPGDPMASVIIDEQSFVFTMQFAKEKYIWPRPVSTTTLPPSGYSGTTGGFSLHETGLNPPTPPAHPPPRDVQATFVLTFNPGLPLAGDAAEKLGERLAKFASGAAYVSATAEAIP
jgi:hypothetical protein